MKIHPLPCEVIPFAAGPRGDHAAEADALAGLDLVALRLDRLATGAAPPPAMLLTPLFPMGAVSLLFGGGGLGKSLVALSLALAVARRAIMPPGGNLGFMPGPLGGAIPPEAAGAAVFVTLEDDRAEVHRRTLSLDREGLRDGAPCYVIPGSDLAGFDPTLLTSVRRLPALTDFARRGLDTLLDRIAAASGHPVRLLVLDPAGDFLDADENDAAPVKRLMRHLREIAQRRGVAVVLLGHVAKAADGLPPTMRGSGAWMANSRAAYGLWRPDPKELPRLTKATGAPAETLLWGALLKANHAGAPVNRHRLFQRDDAGRLMDVTDRTTKQPGATDDDLIPALVAACTAAAAVGAPFSATGQSGVYAGRADLPDPLSTLARSRLEGLAEAAMARGLLVKAAWRGQGRQWLDSPSGALATGLPVEPSAGSRAVALRRHSGAP